MVTANWLRRRIVRCGFAGGADGPPLPRGCRAGGGARACGTGTEAGEGTGAGGRCGAGSAASARGFGAYRPRRHTPCRRHGRATVRNCRTAASSSRKVPYTGATARADQRQCGHRRRARGTPARRACAGQAHRRRARGQRPVCRAGGLAGAGSGGRSGPCCRNREAGRLLSTLRGRSPPPGAVSRALTRPPRGARLTRPFL